MSHPVPYRIRVGDRMYSIDVVESMRRKHEMGCTFFDLKRIEISKTSNVTSRAYTDEEIDDTFWHELTHAILYEMGHKLYKNEAFVTEFAHHLTNAIRSAKFK